MDMRSVHTDGRVIASLLLTRLAEEVGKDTRIIVFVSAGVNVEEQHLRAMAPLLNYWHENNPRLEIYNFMAYLLKLKNENPQEFESLYLKTESAHMSLKGNSLVAMALAKIIMAK